MNYIKEQIVSTLSNKKQDSDINMNDHIDHSISETAESSLHDNELLNGSNGDHNGHHHHHHHLNLDDEIDPAINMKHADDDMLDPAITGDTSSISAAVLAAAAVAAAPHHHSLSPKRQRKTHRKVKKDDQQLIDDSGILNQADAEALAASALSQSPLDTLSLAATSAAAEPPKSRIGGRIKSNIKSTKGKTKKSINTTTVEQQFAVAATSGGIIDENISPELGGGGSSTGNRSNDSHLHDDTTHPDLVAKQEQQTKEFLAQAVAAAVAAGNTAAAAAAAAANNGMHLLAGGFSNAFAEGNMAAGNASVELTPMSIASLTNPTPPGGISSTGGPGGSQASRKKRQCSTCLGWFSNLATHRSTHLSDNSRPHSCEVCGRGFARPNDLFRHQKSHRDDAAFRCPLFVKASMYQNAFGNLEPACHQNGGFSRCDTYKNHLKAMHFEYPAGTKKRDRPGMGGKCKACNMEFENADRWINEHIDTRECPGIKKVEAICNKYEDTSEIEAAAAAAAAAVEAVANENKAAAAAAAAAHDVKLDEPTTSGPGPILPPPSSSANLSETTA